ncbi:MAG: sigma-70 family RNA polymerase sigma factor [Polyangiaceae bacterium]
MGDEMRRLVVDDEAWAELRAAWPSLELSREIFDRYLEEHAQGPPDALHLADLYLACACARGNEGAIALFRERYGPALRHAIGRAAPTALCLEVEQRAFIKLFVSDGDRSPAITSYGGRGKLSTWVQVLARREALNAHRAERRHEKGPVEEAELLRRAVDDATPELRAIEGRLHDAFKQAFADALAQLSARERNLLRYECIDALTREQIAKLYGVTVKTIGRWRAAVRERLGREVKARFVERAAVADSEIESIMRLVDSEVELSLSRLLPRAWAVKTPR